MDVTHPSLFDSSPLLPAVVATSVPVEARYDADAAFDVFWKAYPRKVEKGNARKAFIAQGALRRAGSVQRMLDTIEQWRGEWAERPQFCPYPATWLRADRWEDDPPVRRVQERKLTGREQALMAVARRYGVA